jgi:DMSO/TMAO reductase YedYZ molybdopterin-dependent catalytic subunit
MRTVRRSEVAFETPLEHLLEPLTPNDAFFVRNHARAVPRIDAAAYRLSVAGARGSRDVTLAGLRALPRVAATITLACSGNGRTAFDPRPSGVPWSFGAIGTARWEGVRLRDVLALAGIGDEDAHVVLDAYDDAPPDGRPPFRRSIPLARALHDATIVADTMNGEPLAPEHGGPARLLVAGWTANHAVKWLRRIALSPRPDEGWWMTEDYRVPGPSGAMEIIEAAAPVAILASPRTGATLAPDVLLQGIAYGEPPPQHVRIDIQPAHAAPIDRTDAHHADVRYDDGPYAWGRWSLRLTLTPGPHRLVIRPLDADGNPGPERGTPNPKGYLYNGPHTVQITINPAPMSS